MILKAFEINLKIIIRFNSIVKTFILSLNMKWIPEIYTFDLKQNILTTAKFLPFLPMMISQIWPLQFGQLSSIQIEKDIKRSNKLLQSIFHCKAQQF